MSQFRNCSFTAIADIGNGQVDPQKAPYSSYLHLGPENIEAGTGRIVGDIRTASELDLISGKYLFDADTIVYSKIRPNLNKVCMPDFEGLCSADMYPVKAKEGLIEKEYLYYLMSSSAFLRQTIAASMRTGLPKINRKDLALIKLIVPTEESARRKISRILWTWDIAINKTEKLITLKEKKYLGLKKSLLFGSCRLGRRKTREVLGRSWFSIPADWQLIPIGSIGKEVKEKNASSASHLVLSCTKYSGLVSSDEYFGRRVYSQNTSNYRVVRKGQFAYATNHIEEGSIGYQDICKVGLVSPMYTVFSVDDKSVCHGYLFKLLKTETYRHLFEINTNSSVNRRGSLRWKEFSKIKIPLPSLEEQQEINSALDLFKHEIKLLSKQLEAYKLQKQGLMQKLLTGEWPVNVGKER